jgi:hypothetical protein
LFWEKFSETITFFPIIEFLAKFSNCRMGEVLSMTLAQKLQQIS